VNDPEFNRVKIKLVVQRADGRRSEAEITGKPVTAPMLEAAEDLLETLSTGERPPLNGLYELVARAFSVTRDEAKRRITSAAYGGSTAKP
jgi:hypothetical protein